MAKNKYSGSYVDGNLARKIEEVGYDVYASNKTLNTKKKQKANLKVKKKIFFAAILCISLILGLVYGMAKITIINSEINSSKNQLAEIKNNNSRLSVEIEKEMAKIDVKEIAQGQFGMHKPDNNQYIYMEIPRKSFTKTGTEKEVDNLIFRIVKGLGGLAGL